MDSIRVCADAHSGQMRGFTRKKKGLRFPTRELF